MVGSRPRNGIGRKQSLNLRMVEQEGSQSECEDLSGEGEGLLAEGVRVADIRVQDLLALGGALDRSEVDLPAHFVARVPHMWIDVVRSHSVGGGQRGGRRGCHRKRGRWNGSISA